MEELIKKIQSGDENAFKQLVQSMENDLYRIAKTRLRNDEDIMDAIQNTMIYTYKNSKKVKNLEFFKTWMIKILINECNKIYNSNKKNEKIFNRVVKNSSFNLYDTPIQNINDKINFENLIDKLNYDERMIITLHYNSQFSCTQIAKILNISVNTAKSRLTRGTNKLKKIYEEVNLYESKK